MEEYRFRFNHERSQHGGQGSGESEIGDVIVSFQSKEKYWNNEIEMINKKQLDKYEKRFLLHSFIEKVEYTAGSISIEYKWDLEREQLSGNQPVFSF